MDIPTLLLRRLSKDETETLAAYVSESPERFATLMEAFSVNDWRPSQRAVWVVTKVAERHPELLLPHLNRLLHAMENPVHPAVLRNGLKIFAETGVTLNEEQEGRLVQYAFDLLADPNQAIAIRVFAMQCIANLLPAYPDLAIELKALIEDGMEHGSPGFRSRGRRILRQISRLPK